VVGQGDHRSDENADGCYNLIALIPLECNASVWSPVVIGSFDFVVIETSAVGCPPSAEFGGSMSVGIS